MLKESRSGDPTEAARYAVVAIVLHWLIAALILLQLILATRMGGRPTPATFAVIQLHKSVGVTVLILSLVRLVWRLLNPPPPLPPAMPVWERKLAHWTHAALYLVMLGMPLTGWIMVSASRIPVPTLLFGVARWPMIPGIADLAAPAKAIWREIGEGGHKLIIQGAYLLLALHVAGALKHQLFSDEEPVLARMAPGAGRRRRALARTTASGDRARGYGDHRARTPGACAQAAAAGAAPGSRRGRSADPTDVPCPRQRRRPAGASATRSLRARPAASLAAGERIASVLRERLGRPARTWRVWTLARGHLLQP